MGGGEKIKSWGHGFKEVMVKVRKRDGSLEKKEGRICLPPSGPSLAFPGQRGGKSGGRHVCPGRKRLGEETAEWLGGMYTCKE